MRNETGTKALLNELEELRRRNAELEERRSRLEQAEESLGKSEQRYRNLFENLAAAVILAEPVLDGEDRLVDLKCVAANHAVSKHTNMAPEQLVGRLYSEVFHYPGRNPVFDIYEKVLFTGEPYHGEILLPALNQDYDIGAYLPAPGLLALTLFNITSRKLAEENLLRERNLLQAVMNGARGVHLVYLDRDFNFVRVNEAYAATCGYRPEEMIGKNHFALYPHSGNEAIFAHVRDTGQAFEVRDKPFVFPDQPERGITYWDWTLTPEKDPSGRVTGLIFALVETTERKKAEESLRESEERYRTVIESTTDAIIVTDPACSGRVLSVNPEACRMLGYSETEFLSLTHDDMFDPTDPRLATLLKERDERGRVSAVVTYRRKDGTTFEGEVSGAFFDDRNGNKRAVAIVRDVTERKSAEEALAASRNELQNVTNGATSLIYAFDLEERFLFANKAVAALLDSSLEEMTGKTRSGFMPGETAEWHEANDRKVIEQGHVLEFEEYGPFRQDGRLAAWLTTKFPLRDPKGRIYAVAGISTDITERKDASDELERRVQERTAELKAAYEEKLQMEEALRQAHKMEAIGTLAGGIAHDFNNILAAIIGFTEMTIEDVPDRPLVEKNLQNVLTSATRARELVKQILAFSRKTNQERAPIALSPVVKETVQLLRASIPATVDVSLSVTTTSDTVLAAATEVQQIVMNLATNALLAFENHKGSLEIALSDTGFEPDALALDQASREYLQIMVKDTGVGMTQEVMKRIFEPFFTTREVGKGSGMGLATVYGTVRDLGGTITVESEPGRGSTFRVFLPKAKTKVSEEEKRDVLSRGDERILFVDDEPLLVEWGKEALERLGYAVTAVADGRQALKIFSADPSLFDLVITDQTMPRMSGSDLCRKLLRNRKDIPIILCTGQSEAVTPEKAKEIGIREFLMKPLTRLELASAVRRVLDAYQDR